MCFELFLCVLMRLCFLRQFEKTELVFWDEIITFIHLNIFVWKKRDFCYISFSWALVIYLSLTRKMSWWNRSTCSKLALSVTEKTMRNPSPVLIYCSLIALNSSWPAVSSTVKMDGHKYTVGLLFLLFNFKKCPCDLLTLIILLAHWLSSITITSLLFLS